MKRTKHSLSHYNLVTGDMGRLIPVGWYEVLPGDTVQQSSSALIRVSPLVAPVMHPVSVRIHHWFVPNRIMWEDWEDFITGGPDGDPGLVAPYRTINSAVTAGTLDDYFGVPIGDYTTTPIEVSAFPYRAYQRIYDEYYRDQDLSPAVSINEGGGNDTITSGSLRYIMWEKDRFTMSRPWPQKGPDVTLPLGTRAPVRGIGAGNQSFGGVNLTAYESGQSGPTTYPIGKGIDPASPNSTWYVEGTAASGGFPDIYADLTNASATNINVVRRAFALQRYQEARAQYGSRYTEYLRYLGVRSSDARLQRPEYLGGGKQTIAFSEVLKTGAGEDPAEAIGTMKGHGIAAMRSRKYRRFFEEHGIVISLMSVRPRTMYAQGLAKGLLPRRTKEDYWQRELELIGQEEVMSQELYATANPTTVFGFNDRYADYRHIQSRVSGEFRDTLDYWHMARLFSSEPVLNASFVLCDPTKRIHAVQSAHVLWCMIGHSIQARRMVGKRTIGRIM